MYDQNTGEFVPTTKKQPTTAAPKEQQTQASHPQNHQPANNHQVTVVNNIQQAKSNGAGTAGFVLALISFLFSWMPGVGWFVWFLGALLSVIGCFKKPRGLAITGTIISFFDLILLISVAGALATMFH